MVRVDVHILICGMVQESYSNSSRYDGTSLKSRIPPLHDMSGAQQMAKSVF